MKRYLSWSSLVAGHLVQLALLTNPAFAARLDGGRAELQQETRATRTRIEGVLALENGNYTLKDAKTGRVIRLTHSSGLTQLWEKGQKNVAVEGNFSDAETLVVRNAENI